MKEASIIKKLESMDREIHSIMDELREKRDVPSLSELNRSMEKDLQSDEDPTELIRKMRRRQYSL
ncbi:MAG: hypothetical protein JW724_07145 [Candidatus Altiarchaeota archaeon]|nr:hypothetical protein [Candidatus Altiarchaeota archaeon]